LIEESLRPRLHIY